MAKVVGLVGSASGKIGNIVYSVTNGIQTARVYQPVVYNPKSLAQRIQRAKGNLVGRISGIVPSAILAGLGGNNRERRGRFLSLALKNATTTVDGNSVRAKLDADDFIFSMGSLVPSYSVSSLTATANIISAVISRSSGVDSDVLASNGVLLVVTLLNTDGRYEEVLYRFVPAETLSPEISLTVNLYHSQLGGYECAAYLAPFATVDGSAMTTAFGSLVGDGVDFSAAMASNPNAVPLKWGKSAIYKTATYTPGT